MNTQRLFSVPKFLQHGNTATISRGFINLSFKGKVVAFPLMKSPTPFFTAVPAHAKSVPQNMDKHQQYKPIPMEFLHHHLGHT